MKTRVVNRRARGVRYDVYIGRPSKWGNPFMLGNDGNRDEVIAKFREWIQRQPHLLADLHELRGKVLGCYCAPLACHGHVLAELADALVPCPRCGSVKSEPCGHAEVVANMGRG